MTKLKNAATLFTIAMLSTAPVAAFATQTGSPQQSVDADPDEDVSKKKVEGDSLEDTAKADQGAKAYEDADIVDDAEGSLVEDDAKTDS
ncbi:hypothetical protein OS190_07265 [Sulfitobacter sp. F26204]|uniref:hypothetical protein n=1 Tax=Sulfitobacter sp. F26204 TaxID=2996014 RepID=UPI00225E03CB|nr:hypothetical protein [Sulfitobacter sp. F26204]MCX7559366.1 hypothetical protein [Sulfitobacter sp. F26204]